MSDDLVKRLRTSWDADRSIISQTDNWMRERQEAADRIEELEAKLATCEKYRDAYDKMGQIGTEAYRDLEAKLAKAVEALEKIAQHDMQYWAITTLAELKNPEDSMKGEKDE